MKNYLLALCLIFVLAACGTATIQPEAAETANPISSVELFMSRAHMVDADFEQYKITGAMLFKECGQFHRGRFFAESQELQELTPEQLAKIQERAQELLIHERAEPTSFDPPGRSISAADPGILSLQVVTAESPPFAVKTSLDSITNAETVGRRRMRALAHDIRQAAGGKVCGNPSFYGLGARERTVSPYAGG